LPNAEPLVCIYYFPYWWEPWKNSDEVVLGDLRCA
jgi:predicted RNase H-like nuclease